MKDERARYSFLHEIGLCCVSGLMSEIQVAHIRGPDAQFSKPLTGMAEKPHWVWTLPLCRERHELQHKIGEPEFWSRHGYPWQDAHRSPCHAALILEGFRTLNDVDGARAWLSGRLAWQEEYDPRYPGTGRTAQR